LQTIESFYQLNGFLEAKILDWKRDLIETQDKYKIQIDLNEGNQTLVDEVKFDGLELSPPEKIKKFLLVKEGKFYSAVRLEEDVRAVIVYYSTQGHPYGEVKTKLEPRGPKRVAKRYKIQEGPEVRVGRILYVGNVRTKRQTIASALHFKEGD